MNDRPETFLTSKEAADLLGVTMQTIQNWVAKSYLKAWKTPGGHARIARSSVEELLRQRSNSVENNPAKNPAGSPSTPKKSIVNGLKR